MRHPTDLVPTAFSTAKATVQAWDGAERRHAVGVENTFNAKLQELIAHQQFTEAEKCEQIRQQHEGFDQRQRHDRQIQLLDLIMGIALTLATCAVLIRVMYVPSSSSIPALIAAVLNGLAIWKKARVR